MIFTRFLILLLLLPSAALAAAPGAAFESAAAGYQKIRVSDPKVTKLAAWTKARKDLEQFVAKYPRSNETPQALFDLGELNQSIFTAKKDRSALDKAVDAYELVARRFGGNGLADNALLSLGDLRRNALKDEVAAKAAYFEIIDRYPNGSIAKIARIRLEPPRPAKETFAAAATPAPPAAPLPTATPPAASVPASLPAAKTDSEPVIVKPAASPEPAAATPGALSQNALSQNQLHLDFENTSFPAGTGKELVKEPELYHRPLIVIDPGHGGEDDGAKGVDDLLEKDVVLEISKDFDKLLQDRLRARTFLTRSTDVFIPLPDRTRLANEKNADLFISIHANASEYKTAQGIETYYLDNTKEKSSLKLAERENASLSFGKKENADADVGFILSDLIQNVKLDDSISLAHLLEDSMVGTLSRYYQGITKLGVRKAPFYVLVGAHMPCVLVEVSFIDHPLEGKRLSDKRYQHLIAQSLFEGVQGYFAQREKTRSSH